MHAPLQRYFYTVFEANLHICWLVCLICILNRVSGFFLCSPLIVVVVVVVIVVVVVVVVWQVVWILPDSHLSLVGGHR